MRLLLRSFPILLVVVTLTAALPLLAGNRAHRLVGPPANCEVVKLQGQTYACGRIYLSAHSDTALLAPFGFRKFEFEGWSLGRALYTAVWPIQAPLDELPQQLSELEYNRVEADPEEEVQITGYDGLDEFERELAIEQDAKELLESSRHCAATSRDGKSHKRSVRYTVNARHKYERDYDSPPVRRTRGWNGIYGTVPVRCDSYSPYRSDGYGEYSWDNDTYYRNRRSRRSYGEWDNGYRGSSVSFNRCRSNYDDVYQRVPCGSATTLERTPIQNEYRDWRNSGTPFMNNAGANYGGIGYDPNRYRCR